MRSYVFVVVAVLFLYPSTTAAFTINYSAFRKMIAPQLSTNTMSSSTVSDFFVGRNIVETVLNGSSVGTTSIKDVVYDYFSSGSVETGCTVFVQGSDNTPTYTATDPSIGTINSTGNTTYVSAGTTYFNAKIGRRTRAVPCTFSRTSNMVSYTFDTVVSSSTIQEMKTEVDTRLSGESPSSTTYNLYSAVNDSTQTYTRNPDLYAADVDFTCIPVWSAAAASAQTMGVLVAPDIMIQANHSHPSGTMYFVGNDNVTVSRSITSGTNIAGTDIYVAKLNSAVPAGITPCKVLSATAFTNKISTTAVSYFQPPVIFTNQNRTLKIGKISYGTNTPFSQTINIVKDSVNYNDWYSQPCCGDSGSPAFVLINGEAVVLGVWHTAFSVPNLSGYISQINSAIATLGSSYTLSTVDLSSFHTFNP
ncbi:MAG: hypothetical protein AAB365_01195 [Patescibacteria group bacterium]